MRAWKLGVIYRKKGLSDGLYQRSDILCLGGWALPVCQAARSIDVAAWLVTETGFSDVLAIALTQLARTLRAVWWPFPSRARHEA